MIVLKLSHSGVICNIFLNIRLLPVRIELALLPWKGNVLPLDDGS